MAFVNYSSRMTPRRSVVDLGDLVVERSLHALGVIRVEFGEAGQSLHAIAVLLEHVIFLE